MALTPYPVQVWPVPGGAANIAATATPLGQGISVHSQRSCILNIPVTAVNHAGTLDIKLVGIDAWGNSYDIPGASVTQIVGVSDRVLHVGPGLQAIPNQSVPGLLPAAIQVYATIGGGGDFDIQVCLHLID